MKIEAVSVYMDNIPKEMREAQMAVWEHFYPSMMSHHHTYLSHGRTLDKLLEYTTADILVIADIDAIPLNAFVVHQMAQYASHDGISGNAQSTSHKGDYNHVFVAPSFMAIDVAKYRAIGSPSFEQTARADVAQEVTIAFERAGYQPKFLYPIHFEQSPVPVTLPNGIVSDPPFWITANRPYGLNTTFSFNHKPHSFHGFQSSHDQHNRFIEKCGEVLDGNVWSANNHFLSAEGFFTYPALYSNMVAEANDGDVLVEIGSYKGQSALFMGEAIRNSGKRLRFFAVDHFQGSEEHTDKDFFNQFLVNISPLASWINPVQADSITASQEFPDNHAFFVFIDASHDYESVKADVEAWLPKVKKGGYLAGHDWHHEPVKRAVIEVLGEVDEFDGDCWIKQL
jgi:hypothetical protein